MLTSDLCILCSITKCTFFMFVLNICWKRCCKLSLRMLFLGKTYWLRTEVDMMQHQKVLAVHCLQSIFENRLIGKWLGFEPCDSFNYWWLDLCFMDHYSWYKSMMTIMMMMTVMNRNWWLCLWCKSHTQEVKVDTTHSVRWNIT